MEISILVVDDHLTFNKTLVNALNKEGFNAAGCSDLHSARHLFERMNPDIVLLDIVLGGEKVFSLIECFRRQNNARILVMSEHNDLRTKTICYEKGADDYIIKPFCLYETIYKLRAIVRRIQKENRRIMIGGLIFDETTRTLSGDGRQIALQPSQATLFRLLYDKYVDQNYLSKAETFPATGCLIDETSRLHTLVARLRKNLEYVSDNRVRIETLYGKGYALKVCCNEQRENP
ncbi:MAG: response regulator transcription factor [Eubacteriales bacterium]|nr:response regulator transcription factor [Eubacteriales bacterium]